MKTEVCPFHPFFGIRHFTILCPELEDMDVDDVYFQQDGAMRDTSGETIGLLREKFPGRVISRKGDYNWPPRSCDLTRLLSNSESVKFSLIESVICLFTDSPVKKIFFTVKSVNFH